MNYIKTVEAEYRKLYKTPPLLVRSPGRVNLIGEHTDYNMGFVLPAAIEKAIYFAIGPSGNQLCRLQALDMKEEFRFAVDRPEFSKSGWPNYLMGVVDQLRKSGYPLRGFNCVFAGDIPIGAGLSSSAAIEAGLAFALNTVFELALDKLSLVKLAQKAENEFVGVKCGIMDQFVNIFGSQKNVLRIDCRSLEYEYTPFDFPDTSIVLFDTGVSHSLASSEYNRRREECCEGVAVIRKRHPAVEHLRDATESMVDESMDSMKGKIYRRCKYVVEENGRVLESCRDLKKGDLRTFGSRLLLSHAGLRDDYEVSCRELDYLVEILKDNTFVLGSRMMGGGFGGCTVNIIRNDGVDSVCNSTAEKYKREFNLDLKPYVTTISQGTSLLPAEHSGD